MQPLAQAGGASLLAPDRASALRRSACASCSLSLLIAGYAALTAYELRRGALPEERARRWAAGLCAAHALYLSCARCSARRWDCRTS